MTEITISSASLTSVKRKIELGETITVEDLQSLRNEEKLNRKRFQVGLLIEVSNCVIFFSRISKRIFWVRTV